jgi:hypothetical protein
MAERRRIAIWANVKTTYRLGWDCFGGLGAATIISIVLQFFIGLLRPAPTPAASGSELVMWFGLALLRALVLAPYAVLVHRRILLGEEGRSYWSSTTSRRTARFAVAAVVMAGASSIGSTLSIGAGVLGLTLVVIGYGLSLVSIFALMRLLLAFPAIAIDGSTMPFADSWRMTCGSFWRIFWSFLLVGLPITPLAFVFLWVAGTGGVGWLIGTAGNAVVAALSFAFYVALASHLYATRADWAAEGEPS